MLDRRPAQAFPQAPVPRTGSTTTLANAHAALDGAAGAAYGWDDPDPAAVPEDTILARLLALNLERAGVED